MFCQEHQNQSQKPDFESPVSYFVRVWTLFFVPQFPQVSSVAVI